MSSDNGRNPYLAFSTAAAIGLAGLVASVLLKRSGFSTDSQFHTVLETMATLLALVTGFTVLLRYYQQKNNTYLFIATGFIGTGLLDGYHTVVTSSYMAGKLPSDITRLIPWSWCASRTFLAVFLWLSWWMWKSRREIRESTIYGLAAICTLASFLFFAFARLPAAYYPNIFFHRPEEFVSALFFGWALIGYYQKDEWRYDDLERWLISSLIVGFIGQLVMSVSAKVNDGPFDGAHALKIVSYACVLAGCCVSLYRLLQRSEAGIQMALRANEELQAQISKRK